MRREEVEALLDEALDALGSVGHVDAEHLAALCRRWMAVDSAPVRNVVGQQWDDVFAREGNVVWCSDLHPGQRVRLVPEDGQEVGE